MAEPLNVPWTSILGLFLVTGLCAAEVYTMLSPLSLYRLANLFVWLKKLHQTLTYALGELRWGKIYRYGKSTHEYVVVSEKKHMQELSEATELSQRAVFADMFGFKYTLHRINPHEQNMARYRTFGRVLLSVNRSQFPILQPYLKQKIEESLNCTMSFGKKIDGWTSIRLAHSVRNITKRIMSIMMFGESLANEPDFARALRHFPKDMIAFTACYQFTPEFLAPFVHDLVTNRAHAMHTLFKRLVPIAAREPNKWNETTERKGTSILGILLDNTEGNEYWTPKMLAQALIGIWFAASHQPWVVLHFVIYELCKRPEYIDLLRQEAEAREPIDFNKLEQLPLLNSFIKETVRLNPADKLAVRRKALKQFAFSNGGPILKKGAIACVSSYNQMRDPARYADPDTFDAFRFIPKSVNEPTKEDKNEENSSKFTEVSEHFTAWGFGSLACPGRFHVSLFFKLFIIHVITKYDIRLQDYRSPRGWSWNTFMMPYESSRILIRPRVKT